MRATPVFHAAISILTFVSVIGLVACSSGREQGTLVAVDATTGKQLWRVRPPMAAVSSPVVEGGLVFVEGGDSCQDEQQGTLVAYDAKTGKERWHARTSGGCGGGLSLADGVAIVLDGATFRGLDAGSGQELWTSTLDSECLGAPPPCGSSLDFPPAAAGDVAPIFDESAPATMLRGIDRRSGAVQPWKIGIGELGAGAGGVGRIIVTSKTAFFGLLSGQSGTTCGVVAIDLRTGGERWRQTSQSGNFCTGAAGERLVVSCFFNTSQDNLSKDQPAGRMGPTTITAWDSDTGKEMWEAGAETACGERPAVEVTDNTVFVLGARLQALDAPSGAPRWQIDAPEGASSFAAANDDFVVLFTGEQRTAIAFDARSGERLWEITVPGAGDVPPGATGDRVVYLTAWGNPERSDD